MDEPTDEDPNPSMPQLEDHNASTSENHRTSSQEEPDTSSEENDGIPDDSALGGHNSTDSQGEDPVPPTPIVQCHRPRHPNPVMELEFVLSRGTQQQQKASKCNVVVL